MSKLEKNQNNRISPCVRAKEHMKKTYGETSRRKMNVGNADPLARPFLQMASMNLESAKALYDIENYPDAVFMLQQSIEKITKSFALYFGYLDEKAVQIIAHDVICIYEIIYTHLLEEQKGKEERYKENPMLYSSIDNYRNYLNKRMDELESFRKELYYQKDVTRYRELSDEEIDVYLHSLEQIDIDLTDIFKWLNPVSETLSEGLKQIYEGFFNEEKRNAIFDEISEDECRQMIQEFRVAFAQMIIPNLPESIDDKKKKEVLAEMNIPVDIPENISLKEILKKWLDEMFKSIGEDDKKYFKEISEKFPSLLIGHIDTGILLFVIFNQLLNLAIPVSRHVTLSRYPEPAKNFNPLEFYTLKLPLVASFPRLADHTDKCIINLNYLYHQLDAVNTKGGMIVEADK